LIALLVTASACSDSKKENINNRADTQESATCSVAGDPVCSVSVNGDRSRIFNAAAVTPHRQYDQTGNKENDLALIFLDQDAPADLQPLPISLEEEDLTPETPVYIAGYGRQTDLAVTPDNSDLHLRYTTLYPSKDKSNGEFGRRLENSPGGDLLILDSDKGTAACSGDSGGPAMIMKEGRLTAVGIASFVYDREGRRATCMSRVAYTRPSALRNWLIENSRGLIMGPSTSPVEGLNSSNR
jgi:secreted trypsin-like serine protease